MSKKIAFGLGAMIFMGIAASSYGQVNTTEGAQVSGHGRVNSVARDQKKEDQKIAEGVSTGKLSERETEELKRKENQIQSEKTQAMMKHHGHLTKGAEKKLKRAEKELKKETERDLNNAETR